MKNYVSSLTVPCRLDYLVPLAAFVQELSRLMDFNEKERSQIDLGVEEAVSNVIKHGLEYNPDESFSLICEESPTALTIRILEKGVPFDPAKAPKYSPEHAGEDVSGLGTFLMRASMDIVEYHNLGRAGKKTVLIKNIGKKRIDSLVESKELVPDGDVPRVEELPPFTIRSPLPDEAIEISKCAYRSYGYSYVADYIYFPDKIIEYNRSGQMISGVAVTDDGVLMGHAALKLPDKEAKIAEIGVAFVRPDFRKRGLLEKITAFLFKQAAEQELEGIFSQAVTSHVASQRALYSQGGVDCGVALAFLQGDISFKSLVGDVTQRESLLIWYLPIISKKHIIIYPPARHREILKTLYERLAIPVKIDKENISGKIGQDEGDIVQAAKNQMLNSAEIKVFSCGETAFATTRDHWKRYCLEKTDVIFLYINMEDPWCPDFTTRCEELGFFFCGILPGGVNGREALILQYLNNLNFDYERVKLWSPNAQELLRYIRSQDPNVA